MNRQDTLEDTMKTLSMTIPTQNPIQQIAAQTHAAEKYPQWLVGTFVLILLAIIPAVSMATLTGERIEGIAAIVNDEIITSLELEKEIRGLKADLQRQRIGIPGDDVLRRQVLDRMVIMRIQLQNAKRRNILIDDSALNSAIESIASQNKMELPEFRQALQSTGFDYADYRERIRQEMVIGQLQKREVSNRVVVTEQEIELFIANQAVQESDKEEYRLEHILVSIPEAASSEQIQKAREKALAILAEVRGGANFAQTAIAKSEGQQALSGGDLGWRKREQIPGLFADQLDGMEVGTINDLIRSPSGYHIIHLAEKRRETKQHFIEQIRARHILIKNNGVISGDEAITRLQQLKQRIESGESFSELAAAHSEDRGSAVQGGDLGWVSPGVMVREFEEQMNKLQPDQLSEPFQSRFGWHLVQVLERRNFDDTGDFQKNQARSVLLKRKTEPAVENWLRRLRDEAFVELRI